MPTTEFGCRRPASSSFRIPTICASLKRDFFTASLLGHIARDLTVISGVKHPLRSLVKTIAAQRRRFGYRKIGILVRREGIVANHTRIYRIYTREGLAVRSRKRRHLRIARGKTPPAVTRPNERWSIDFVSDSFASGRAMRALTVVDDCTHEGLAVDLAFHSRVEALFVK